MGSWRDQVSAQAQADLDALLDVVVPYAQQQLANQGSFAPFGAVVTSAGDVDMRSEESASPRQSGAAAVLVRLYAAVRADRDRARAAAFVADVHVDGSPAIRVELEHVEGAWMTVVMPYSRQRFRKAVTYHPLGAAPAESHVWAGGPA